MNEIMQEIGRIGIVPVVAIENAADAVPLGQALLDAELPCAETVSYTHLTLPTTSRV